MSCTATYNTRIFVIISYTYCQGKVHHMRTHFYEEFLGVFLDIIFFDKTGPLHCKTLTSFQTSGYFQNNS